MSVVTPIADKLLQCRECPLCAKSRHSVCLTTRTAHAMPTDGSASMRDLRRRFRNGRYHRFGARPLWRLMLNEKTRSAPRRSGSLIPAESFIRSPTAVLNRRRDGGDDGADDGVASTNFRASRLPYLRPYVRPYLRPYLRPCFRPCLQPSPRLCLPSFRQLCLLPCPPLCPAPMRRVISCPWRLQTWPQQPQA